MGRETVPKAVSSWSADGLSLRHQDGTTRSIHHGLVGIAGVVGPHSGPRYERICSNTKGLPPKPGVGSNKRLGLLLVELFNTRSGIFLSYPCGAVYIASRASPHPQPNGQTSLMTFFSLVLHGS